MKFYKNKWFWALALFVILSVSWNAYNSFARNKNATLTSEKPKANEQPVLQVAQDNMLPDTRLSMNEELQNKVSSVSQNID